MLFQSNHAALCEIVNVPEFFFLKQMKFLKVYKSSKVKKVS